MNLDYILATDYEFMLDFFEYMFERKLFGIEKWAIRSVIIKYKDTYDNDKTTYSKIKKEYNDAPDTVIVTTLIFEKLSKYR